MELIIPIVGLAAIIGLGGLIQFAIRRSRHAPTRAPARAVVEMEPAPGEAPRGSAIAHSRVIAIDLSIGAWFEVFLKAAVALFLVGLVLSPVYLVLSFITGRH